MLQSLLSASVAIFHISPSTWESHCNSGQFEQPSHKTRSCVSHNWSGTAWETRHANDGNNCEQVLKVTPVVYSFIAIRSLLWSPIKPMVSIWQAADKNAGRSIILIFTTNAFDIHSLQLLKVIAIVLLQSKWNEGQRNDSLMWSTTSVWNVFIFMPMRYLSSDILPKQSFLSKKDLNFRNIRKHIIQNNFHQRRYSYIQLSWLQVVLKVSLCLEEKNIPRAALAFRIWKHCQWRSGETETLGWSIHHYAKQEQCVGYSIVWKQVAEFSENKIANQVSKCPASDQQVFDLTQQDLSAKSAECQPQHSQFTSVWTSWSHFLISCHPSSANHIYTIYIYIRMLILAD